MYRDEYEARALAAEERVRQLEEENERLTDRLVRTTSTKKRERLDTVRRVLSNNMPALLAALGVVLVVSLFAILGPPGCNTESIHGGFITNLYHHHPYTTTSTTCVGSGRSRSCHPVIHHHPEKWTVEICDEGECIRPSVTEARWDELHLGEFYCVTPPCARHEEHEELYNRD